VNVFGVPAAGWNAEFVSLRCFPELQQHPVPQFVVDRYANKAPV
jgi:hypothetical protein